MKVQIYKYIFSLPIFIFILFLYLSCSNHKVLITSDLHPNIEIDSNSIKNQDFINLIEPYKKELDILMNTKLSYSKDELNKSGLSSPLANLTADLIFNYSKSSNIKPDFVLLNHEGLRSNISKGVITQKTIYELSPFENQLVYVQISGKKVQEFINYMISTKKGHPISNISIKKNGEIIETKIGGKDFDSITNYWVVTSDYLSLGGDNMSFFKNPIQTIETGKKIRDILISEISKIDTIVENKEERFIIK